MDNNEKVEEQLNTEPTIVDTSTETISDVPTEQGELPVINPLSDSVDSTEANSVTEEQVNEEPTIISTDDQTNQTIEEIDNSQSELPIINPIENNVTETVETTPTSDNQVTSEQPQNEKIEIVEAKESNVVPRTDMESDQSNVVISSSINGGNTSNEDENAIVNENLKKVEINYTPPSKLKLALLIIFFVFLIGFVLFLPDITSFVAKFKSGELNGTEEKITTGRLTCTLNTNTKNLDKNYKLVFSYSDSKLEKTEFSITTKGDATLDEETLDELAATCKQLKENVEGMKGVIIQCDYTDGKLVEIQSFDLSVVNNEELTAAFTEAGGNNPEYQYQQDIDRIERNMNASNYTCSREAR